jgi:hypothetical protein
VSALGPSEVVGPLEPAFHTVFRAKWLAAEERESGEVDCRIASAREGRKSVVQAAPRKLKAELIEEGIRKRSGLLTHNREIPGLLFGSTIPGVLAEVLILGVYLDAGDERRGDTGPDGSRIPAIPDVIEPQRPKAGSLPGRVISEKRNEALETCRQEAWYSATGRPVFGELIPQRRQSPRISKQSDSRRCAT